MQAVFEHPGCLEAPRLQPRRRPNRFRWDACRRGSDGPGCSCKRALGPGPDQASADEPIQTRRNLVVQLNVSIDLLDVRLRPAIDSYIPISSGQNGRRIRDDYASSAAAKAGIHNSTTSTLGLTTNNASADYGDEAFDSAQFSSTLFNSIQFYPIHTLTTRMLFSWTSSRRPGHHHLPPIKKSLGATMAILFCIASFTFFSSIYASNAHNELHSRRPRYIHVCIPASKALATQKA
mmetsp:Transcript_14318/g.40739  ORF Transcript_14318/g.40739 Transcript_14318/m.40739 type:complete len:235 (-) Transcript_14318:102-806(-)